MIALPLILAALVWLGFFPPPAGPPYGFVHWFSGGLAFLVYAWAPGHALVRLLLPGAGDEGAAYRVLALPLAVGPIAAGTVTILANLAGLSFPLAARLPVILAALLLVVPARRAEGAPPGNGRGSGAALALFTAALVAGLYLVNPWLHWRADGRFHIGVVGEILRGGLPPTDPFFAGLDLQYMWFFHAVAAAIVSLSGMSTAALLALFNVVCAFAFVILVARLSRGLGHGGTGAVLAAALVVFAMGGLSWIWLPVKALGAFTGTVRGMEEIRKLFEPFTEPRIASTMGFFALRQDQPFFLRKFLVGTAMAPALLAFAAETELARRVLFGGRAADLVLLVLAAGGAIVLHPMMGIPATAVVCAVAVLLPLWHRVRPFAEPVRIADGVRVVAAALLGALASLPYMLLVTHGKEGESGFPIAFVPMKILSLAAGSVGVGIPALVWLFRLRKERNPARGDALAVLWMLLLAGFAAFVRFPLETENIDKPTLLVHMALSLPAAWAIATWLGGRRRASARAYLALLLVPANLLIFAGYAAEPDPRTYRPHEKEAFHVLNRKAEWNALVFDSQDRDRPAVEIRRRQYWSHEQFAETHEYPVAEMSARRGLRDALYGPTAPGDAVRETLAALGAPVYVIVRAGAAVPGAGFPPGRGSTAGSFAAGDRDPLAGVPFFTRIFDTDDVRLYRFTGVGSPPSD